MDHKEKYGVSTQLSMGHMGGSEATQDPQVAMAGLMTWMIHGVPPTSGNLQLEVGLQGPL